MTMIINETGRLYPTALNLRRTNACPVRLGEVPLPPYIDIIIPSLVSHNDPVIWGEDAHLFKPERFTQGVTGAVMNTNAYLLFGIRP